VRTLTDGAGDPFSPDMVWMKDRDSTVSWVECDTGRGATKEISLDIGTDVSVTVAQSLKSFNASGYTLGTDSKWNASTSKQVAYCWKEEATIFDITSYVGARPGVDVTHGMSVAPDAFIVKDYNSGSDVQHWFMYHGHTEVADPETDSHQLNTIYYRTDTQNWDYFVPTASKFRVGDLDSTNKSGSTFLAWLWGNVEGYSKFGSYEGNGSTDGPFVWLGFRPALLILKSVDSTCEWYIYDHKNAGYNPDNDHLLITTAAEGTADEVDFLSNGFKLRIATDPNVSETYIYLAWAEFPFGGDGVAQARAR